MSRTILPILLIAALLAPVTRADDSLYDTIVKQYLAGDFDPLEETLKPTNKDLAAFTAAQKADLTYIRLCLGECHPAWWNQVKSGKNPNLHQVIFGQSMTATYDPAVKGNVQFNSTNGRIELRVNWPLNDMDNTAQAEHGFTKGELNNFSVFTTLGMAEAYSTLPLSTMINPTEEKKLLFNRVVDYRGDVAGVYYGSPRARQWGLWLFMHSYQEKYAKLPTLNCRKAIAVTFMADVIANPKKYPSIKLPKTLDADKAEDELAAGISAGIEKHGWTLAEDKSIRDIIKLLSASNNGLLNANGKVNLPANLAMSLEPTTDAQFLTARNAWFKKQFDAQPAAK